MPRPTQRLGPTASPPSLWRRACRWARIGVQRVLQQAAAFGLQLAGRDDLLPGSPRSTASSRMLLPCAHQTCCSPKPPGVPPPCLPPSRASAPRRSWTSWACGAATPASCCLRTARCRWKTCSVRSTRWARERLSGREGGRGFCLGVHFGLRDLWLHWLIAGPGNGEDHPVHVSDGGSRAAWGVLGPGGSATTGPRGGRKSAQRAQRAHPGVVSTAPLCLPTQNGMHSPPRTLPAHALPLPSRVCTCS